MKSQAYVILSIVLTIIIAVFAVINIDQVEVNYLFWTYESPLILVILFSVLMGGIIVAISGAVRIFHLQKELKTVHLKNDQLRKQIEKHDIPIQENNEKIKESKETNKTKE